MFSIANFLTIMRLFICPIYLLIYLFYPSFNLSLQQTTPLLLSLLIISEASDALDGYIARRFNQVTDFGKILDPMADSISRTTYFIAFTQGPINLSVFVVFIFVYRDAIISTLRTMCALKGIALAARPTGKLKAIFQSFAAFLITLTYMLYSYQLVALATLKSISAFLGAAVALFTLLSASEYLWAYRKTIRAIIYDTAPAKSSL